ncbi:cohesin domain-containing protein [uncultured Clostridium sp.]|uniref:cohesin domain-containing protein n=1 Tax=uncultured Clostridium sp. TaxID=59620 RepID=UPI00258E76EA|nr:cohesin domain-containing protein [uncultured Clostridium sp.]
MKFKLLNNLKKISLMLCFAMLFQIASINVVKTHADEKVKLTYSIKGEVKVSSTIEIYVNISNISNLYGGSVDFVYDKSLLEVQSIKTGSIFGSEKVQTPVENKGNGQANLAFTLTGLKAGINNKGTVAVIKAKILKEGAITLKTTTKNDALSINGNNVRVKLVNSNEKTIDYASEDFKIDSHKKNPLNSSILEENIPNVMEAGKVYPITLKFKNTGSTTWSAQDLFRLGVLPNEFSVPSRVKLNSVVKPGEIATFTFNMTAPNKAGSSLVFNTQILKEGVNWFGAKISKRITIKPRTSDNQVQPLMSELVSENIPNAMEVGKVYPVTIKLKNTGSTTWSAQDLFRLGVLPNEFNVASRVRLNSVVKSGEVATFTFNMTAPNKVGSSLVFNAQILKEGVNWFGAKVSKKITIKPKTSDNQVQPLMSELVSENIPNTMEAGKVYPVTIKLKNIGSTTWSAQDLFRLGVLPNEFGVASRVRLNSVVKPGEIATFTFNMTAPKKSGSSLTFNTQILKEGVNWFGAKVSKKITIK